MGGRTEGTEGRPPKNQHESQGFSAYKLADKRGDGQERMEGKGVSGLKSWLLE